MEVQIIILLKIINLDTCIIKKKPRKTKRTLYKIVIIVKYREHAYNQITNMLLRVNRKMYYTTNFILIKIKKHLL